MRFIITFKKNRMCKSVCISINIFQSAYGRDTLHPGASLAASETPPPISKRRRRNPRKSPPWPHRTAPAQRTPREERRTSSS